MFKLDRVTNDGVCSNKVHEGNRKGRSLNSPSLVLAEAEKTP